MIPTKIENPNGLHQKYQIRKITGYKEGYRKEHKKIPITNRIDPSAEYFVLRLDEEGEYNHVMACREAIQAYAKAIQEYLPQLADELRNKYPVISAP